MGVVTNHAEKSIRGKLTNRGKTCIFVGYSDKNAGNVYRMFNPTTGRILLSRDIIWLDKTYGQYHNLKPGKIHYVTSNQEEVEDTESTNGNDTYGNQSDNDELPPPPTTPEQQTGRETTS